jgi:hypothetical protein
MAEFKYAGLQPRKESILDLHDISKNFSILALCFSLSACAIRPDDIKANAVSADEYKDFSCQQLDEVIAEFSAAESSLVKEMNSDANSQAAANAVGGAMLAVIGFGFIETVGNSDYASELAIVRGELNAARTQAKKMNCESRQNSNSG